MMTAYILGVVTVVVILLGVVSIAAFFRVKQVEKQFYELDRWNSDCHREINDYIGRVEREFQAALDSRLDKLENKFTTKK
jgi:hypothetical protein